MLIGERAKLSGRVMKTILRTSVIIPRDITLREMKHAGDKYRPGPKDRDIQQGTASRRYTRISAIGPNREYLDQYSTACVRPSSGGFQVRFLFST